MGLVLVGECLPTLERPSVWADLPFSYVFARIRAYLRYGEPEGGKLSTLYQNPGTISRFEKTMDLGPGAWGPCPKVYRFFRTTYCARILIEGARFPPFGFATAEISSHSNEDVSF